jgi:hypothetical protein
VVRSNLCPRDLSEVGGAADKDACAVHATNIISQWQYFVAGSLLNTSVMSLVYTVYAFFFPSTREQVK